MGYPQEVRYFAGSGGWRSGIWSGFVKDGPLSAAGRQDSRPQQWVTNARGGAPALRVTTGGCVVPLGRRRPRPERETP
jgi:hypothetical protein